MLSKVKARLARFVNAWDWPVLITWLAVLATGVAFWWLIYRLLSGLASMLVTLP